MSLSQKHDGKSFVPWFCSAEWHYVYDQIFGSTSNDKSKSKALDIIHIWKSRTPFLSRGVEGTYIILQAALLDKSVYDIYNLKIILSTSIMRFLNICAAYNKTQGTFYTTANRMKIPEWLINLRHDIAHGQNLPSMDVLDRAMKFSLEWLHQEYWKPTSSNIKDFIDDTQFESDKAETLKYFLQPLLSNYCYVTLLTHSSWAYNKINDISDLESRTIFLEEIKSMTNSEDINQTTEICRVLEILWQKIEQILEQFEDLENRYHILAELIVEDVFLGNIENREDIFQDVEVPKDFIILWETMLINFGTDMLGALIEKLLQVLAVNNVSHESKIVAATWILEIANGLDKSMFVRSIYKEIIKTGSKPKKFIQSIIDEKLSAKYKTKIILTLNKKIEIPDIITDCFKFKKIVLQKPTPYTKIFISELLNLNDTLKLSYNREHILELINIYVSGENNHEIEEFNQIHNVEEFDSSAMVTDNQDTEKEKIFIENKSSNIVSDNSQSNIIWRRVTETNFEKCPIGILPWQSTAMNPLLII